MARMIFIKGREQGTGIREQGSEKREQATGNRGQRRNRLLIVASIHDWTGCRWIGPGWRWWALENQVPYFVPPDEGGLRFEVSHPATKKKTSLGRGTPK